MRKKTTVEDSDGTIESIESIENDRNDRNDRNERKQNAVGPDFINGCRQGAPQSEPELKHNVGKYEIHTKGNNLRTKRK